MYVILLFLGLGIGAAFLVVLLIGDRKEARLEARQRRAKEQMRQANQPVDGAWPPPPSVSAPPASDFSPYAAPVKPGPTRASNRAMVRTFFLARNYAASILVLSYIVYSFFPRLPFGWVLAATALAALTVWGVLTLLRRSKQRPL